MTISLIAVPEVSAAVVYGLCEVFVTVGMWEMYTGERTDVRPMLPRIVGSSTETFRTVAGALMAPAHTFDEAHRTDVVIVGDLAVDPTTDPRGKWADAVRWLRRQYDEGATVCSVCTGSLMLAEAGLLDGLEATTHWSVNRTFRDCYGAVSLRPERVIMPVGPGHRIVTGGGYSSWNDLALYLVARFRGNAEARRIAKMFLIGDRSQGQLCFAAMARPRQHDDAVISESQLWIADHYVAANPVACMAKQSGLAPRTFKRRFTAATGYAPLDYVQTLRIEEAKQVLESTDTAIDEIAALVGYDDPNSFRRLFKRTTGVTPHEYRQRFQKIAGAKLPAALE